MKDVDRSTSCADCVSETAVKEFDRIELKRRLSGGCQRRSAMRRSVGYLCCALVVVGVLRLAVADDGPQRIRALIVKDLGTGFETTVARMDALGWTVGSINALDLLERDGAELRSQWDVIWIPPDSDYDLLRLFSKSGGQLETFANAGGVVVLPGISAAQFRIDVAPGGVDVAAVATPGPTTITDPDHLLVSGVLPGTTNLTADDLDPDATGGDGCFVPPSGAVASTSSHIAHNNEGGVVGEYSLGEGHALVSLLDLTDEVPLNNTLLYVEHLIRAE
jgi:hypothetical protein